LADEEEVDEGQLAEIQRINQRLDIKGGGQFPVSQACYYLS